MKRESLLRHLRRYGCVLRREGKENPQTGHAEAVPRHTEIADLLARRICQNLSIPRPPGQVRDRVILLFYGRPLPVVALIGAARAGKRAWPFWPPEVMKICKVIFDGAGVQLKLILRSKH